MAMRYEMTKFVYWLLSQKKIQKVITWHGFLHPTHSKCDKIIQVMPSTYQSVIIFYHHFKIPSKSDLKDKPK